MKEIDVIVDKEKLYRLFEDNNSTKYIGVLCGGVAMYEMKIKLSATELSDYESEGKSYLDRLALNMARHPSLYESRAF